jgi:hypothetical protein
MQNKTREKLQHIHSVRSKNKLNFETHVIFLKLIFEKKLEELEEEEELFETLFVISYEILRKENLHKLPQA